MSRRRRTDPAREKGGRDAARAWFKSHGQVTYRRQVSRLVMTATGVEMAAEAETPFTRGWDAEMAVIEKEQAKEDKARGWTPEYRAAADAARRPPP